MIRQLNRERPFQIIHSLSHLERRMLNCVQGWGQTRFGIEWIVEHREVRSYQILELESTQSIIAIPLTFAFEICASMESERNFSLQASLCCLLRVSPNENSLSRRHSHTEYLQGFGRIDNRQKLNRGNSPVGDFVHPHFSNWLLWSPTRSFSTFYSDQIQDKPALNDFTSVFTTMLKNLVAHIRNLTWDSFIGRRQWRSPVWEQQNGKWHSPSGVMSDKTVPGSLSLVLLSSLQGLIDRSQAIFLFWFIHYSPSNVI
jgi:hypothetical protein